jgi:hypothetical protein
VSGWAWFCCTTLIGLSQATAYPAPGGAGCFAVLEKAVEAGHVADYSIATWAGLEEEPFTVEELLAQAGEVVVSLVMTPITQALDGRGLLPAAAGRGCG